MTHIDLFSGIGGFALAAQWAGIKTVQFVEIDPFCQKVLNKNFPGISIHDDIKTFKWLGSTPFILTGGFPCQPFSCAGKRRGKEDDRYIWPEMLRVISEAKPTWVIGENVAGFINMGLDDCISDLEREGYEVQPLIIPACAVNAPHRRDRVWIVANRIKQSAEISDTRTMGIAYEKESAGGKTCIYNAVAYSDCYATNTELWGCEQKSGWSGLLSEANRQEENPSSCIGSWNEPWPEVAARLCRVDARVSNRVDRLKSLGNAVVPQIPYLIMKSIVEIR